MKKNSGYTLIEFIIVLAIMAVLSGMAFVTLGIIKQAKCSAAASELDNQMANIWIKTKALSQSKVQSSSSSDIPSAKYPLCAIIKKNTDSGDNIKDGKYEVLLGYDNGNNFILKESLTALDSIIEVSYSSSAGAVTKTFTSIDYSADSTRGSDTSTDINQALVIEFNKADGSVLYGAGSYHIVYNGKVTGDVYLDGITGNHYLK